MSGIVVYYREKEIYSGIETIDNKGGTYNAQEGI